MHKKPPLILFLTGFIILLLMPVVAAVDNQYKNDLMKLDVGGTLEGTANITVFTAKPYHEPLKVVPKGDNEYVILLPETSNSASKKIISEKSGGDIESIEVKNYPYPNQNQNNGYTKIIIKTKKPLSFTASAQTGSRPAAVSNQEKQLTQTKPLSIPKAAQRPSVKVPAENEIMPQKTTAAAAPKPASTTAAKQVVPQKSEKPAPSKKNTVIATPLKLSAPAVKKTVPEKPKISAPEPKPAVTPAAAPKPPAVPAVTPVIHEKPSTISMPEEKPALKAEEKPPENPNQIKAVTKTKPIKPTPAKNRPVRTNLFDKSLLMALLFGVVAPTLIILYLLKTSPKRAPIRVSSIEPEKKKVEKVKPETKIRTPIINKNNKKKRDIKKTCVPEISRKNPQQTKKQTAFMSIVKKKNLTWQERFEILRTQEFDSLEEDLNNEMTLQEIREMKKIKKQEEAAKMNKSKNPNASTRPKAKIKPDEGKILDDLMYTDIQEKISYYEQFSKQLQHQQKSVSKQAAPAAAVNQNTALNETGQPQNYINTTAQTEQSQSQSRIVVHEPHYVNSEMKKFYCDLGRVLGAANPYVSAKHPISPNKGFYLVKYEEEQALLGYIKNEIFFLTPVEIGKNDTIQARIAEKREGKDLYLVKVNNYKAIIEVTRDSMSFVLEI